MKFLHLLWSNLKRKKLRTLLTILSIVVAFTLFGFLSAIKQALAGGISLAGANRLITRHRVSIIQMLPASYKQRIERIPGVSGATHFTWFGGAYQDSKHFFPQMPVEPEKFLELHPEFLLPADARAAWLRTRTGAVVGRKLANQFGWKTGDRVPIRSNIWPKKDGNFVWDFEIVGIFDGKEKGTDTTQMFFHYDYFDEARGGLQGSVGWYAVRVENPAKAAELALAVDREFENSPAETKTETEGAFVQGFVAQVGNITLLTVSILGAVFFTILLVTANTMAQAVRERTGELGVLKAIGFASWQVLLLILAESCFLAVVGGGVGLGLALLLTSGGDPTGGLLPLYFFPAHDVLLGVAISVLLGVFAGILPALEAMKLRVADALRRM